MHHHRMARDDRHSYAPLSRFLDAGALAQCEIIEAAPAAPAIPRVAALAANVDAALDSLWT
jgi:hypothetical protein